MKVDQKTFFKNLLATTTVHEKARMVVGPLGSAKLTISTLQSRPTTSEILKEYMGFKQ